MRSLSNKMKIFLAILFILVLLITYKFKNNLLSTSPPSDPQCTSKSEFCGTALTTAIIYHQFSSPGENLNVVEWINRYRAFPSSLIDSANMRFLLSDNCEFILNPPDDPCDEPDYCQPPADCLQEGNLFLDTGEVWNVETWDCKAELEVNLGVRIECKAQCDARYWRFCNDVSEIEPVDSDSYLE